MIVHPLMVFRCGDNWTFSGPLNDAQGNPLDLSGATITWKLDNPSGEATNLTPLTLGAGIQIINENTATVLYGPSAAQTATLSPGTYYDCLKVVLSDGETYTTVEGPINALPSL